MERVQSFFVVLARFGPAHGVVRTLWWGWRWWWLRSLARGRQTGLRCGSPRFWSVDEVSPLLRTPVRIVVPTTGRDRLVERCVESIERTCESASYRLTIVDTGARSPDARARITRFAERHDVLRWQRPFHFARINNVVVRETTEPLILLLNDDTEALEPGWLERLAALASQSDVGVAGALLLYPDQTIQHAGVYVDCDPPTDHLARGVTLERWQSGPFARQPFEVSAVTGAALMCRREVYEKVGGMSERFSVAYNDIDLCLRIRRAGWRCAVHPGVQFIHYESQSRGRFHRPEEESRFLRRWAGVLAAGDPFRSYYDAGDPQ